MDKKQKTAGGFSAIIAFLAIALALIAGILIYKFIFVIGERPPRSFSKRLTSLASSAS